MSKLHRNRFGARWLVLLAAVALVVAACDTSETSDDTSTTAASSTAAAPTPTTVADTAGLRPVETIKLLTKTAADDPARYEQARLIAEAWSSAGIPAEIEPVANVEIGRRGFSSKEFDVYLIQYDPTIDRLDPENFLARFWSEKAVDDGSNLSGYRNSTYDDMYLAQANATSQDDRLDIVHEMQQLLAQDVPAAPYLSILLAGVYNSADWTGFTKSTVGSPVYSIWNALSLTSKGEPEYIVVSITEEAQDLNPVTAAQSQVEIPLSYMYDSLLRVGPDGELVNWAAEEVTIDGTSVSVTLREGMVFHDGEPVTGEDVAFSFAYLAEKESPLYAGRLSPIESITVDGNNVEITLSAPNAAFPTTALAQVPILPMHIWSGIDDPASFVNDHPIGSGPFKFESRRLGTELRVAANTDHFNPPSAPGLAWAVFGSLDASIGAVERGEVDILGDFVSTTQVAALEGIDGVTIESNISHGSNLLHYNMRIESLSDAYMRRALTYLVPSQDMIDIVYEGEGVLVGSIILTPLWNDTSLLPVETSVDLALAELAKAGYVFGEDGTLYYPPDGSDNRDLDNS